MKVQWELLLGLFIINLSVGVVIGLALPGAAYTSPIAGELDAEEYEERFNATGLATEWKGTPFSGIPIVGDIFAGFSFLYQNIQYIVDGLPRFMDWISASFIQDSTAQAAFLVIANALRAIYAFLIAMFVVEFISGRVFSD